MNVQGPGGIVVQFPDGTPPATVDAVMRQATSGQKLQPNMGRGTRDQRESIDPRDEDIAQQAVRTMSINDRTGGSMIPQKLPGASDIAGLVAMPSGMFNGLGMGETFQRAKEAQDLVSQAYNARHPVTGRVADLAAGSMVGPGAGGVGFGRGALEAGTVAAGEGATQGNTLQDRAINAGIGGVTGLALGGFGSKAVNPGIAARPGAEAVDAATRLGITMPKVVGTDSRSAQMAGQGIASTFMGSPLRNAVKGGQEQLAAKVAETAAKAGNVGDKASAGTAARDALNQYVTDASPGKVTAAYDTVDPLVMGAGATTSPIHNTSLKALEILKKNEAKGRPPGPALDYIRGSLEKFTNQGGLTYEGIKGLRTDIREMLGDPRLLPQGGSKAEFKQIYGALTKDLENAVREQGGNVAAAAHDAVGGAADLRAAVQQQGAQAAGAAFEKANSLAASEARLKAGLVKIVGAKGDNAGEAVFNKLANAARTGGSANVDMLARARQALSKEDWGDLSASVINEMGKMPDGTFSASRFTTDYGKMSAQGRDAMFGKAGSELRAALDDLHKVAERYKDADKLVNYSRTGNVNAAIGLIGGMFISPLHTISGAVGANVMARLLARPAAVRSMTSWARAARAFSTTSSRTAAMVLRNQTRTLAGTLAREAGDSGLTAQIEQALLSTPVGGSAPSGADRNSRVPAPSTMRSPTLGPQQ